jgi:hypothetical protein
MTLRETSMTEPFNPQDINFQTRRYREQVSIPNIPMKEGESIQRYEANR